MPFDQNLHALHIIRKDRKVFHGLLYKLINSFDVIAGDGGIANEEKASGHRLHYSKAFIQEKAPYWEATAAYKGELTDVKLTDYAGKYLVMLFYPNAFTFVCPTEILAFNDRIAEFRSGH